MSLSSRLSNRILHSPIPFEPSSWQLENINVSLIPSFRIPLGRFPTPTHQISIPELEGLDVWIKRDDLSSADLSGNKVRKLEFLLADCIQSGYDSVITIGGLQSNHARATAVAARQLGLEPHLILRTTLPIEEIDVTGNLLWNRMVGSKIYTVSPGTYARVGSGELVKQLRAQLVSEGKNPYPIPVGGSNTLGSFGYMETMKEIMQDDIKFDHIVFACGSGGTAAGMALAVRLSGHNVKLHAVGVCDTPKYFYDHIREVANELKIDFAKFGQPEDWISIYNGQGIGYAKSTTEELQFLLQLSSTTGVLLDPVYSGKAFYYLTKNLVREGHIRKEDKVLFIHTGGVFGLYDKANQLLPILPSDSIEKLKVIAPDSV